MILDHDLLFECSEHPFDFSLEPIDLFSALRGYALLLLDRLPHHLLRLHFCLLRTLQQYLECVHLRLDNLNLLIFFGNVLLHSE